MDSSGQHVAFLALGSNLGDRLGNLRAAVHRLQAAPGIALDTPGAVARVYETVPVDMAAGVPAFLNTAVRVRTTLPPRELLSAALAVEAALGRVRSAPGLDKSGAQSRVIDIDLLFYDDCILNDPSLTVPHPRMHGRGFVLEPLAEIAGGVMHPVLRVDVAALARIAREHAPDIRFRVAAEAGWER